MKFNVSGTFRANKKTQAFNISVDSKNEKLAREKAFCLLGSWYKCKRNLVKITEVKEVK